MKLRHASMDDLKKITAVEALCFPATEAATEPSFRDRLTHYPNHFWLLEDQETLVGFVNGMVTSEADLCDEMYVNASLHDEKGQWQMIFGVNTIPSYRRQGCAEKIMRQVIADAKKQQRRGLVLTCKKNLAHYYQKFGFVDEGISESEHGGEVWYKMRLTF